MNLSELMGPESGKRASILDHDWWVDGLPIREGEPNYDARDHHRDNNSKIELQTEFNMQTTDPVFGDFTGEVECTPSNNEPWHRWDSVDGPIVFARDMMNSGKIAREVDTALKNKFTPGILREAASALRELFGMDGMIGRFVIDGTGYKSCSDALKLAQNSPFKGFVRYVSGCSCGDHVLFSSSEGHQIENYVEPTGDIVGDMLQAGQNEEVTQSHCPSTMLPVLGEDVGDTQTIELLDKLQMTNLSSTMASELVASDLSNIQKLKIAFRRLDDVEWQEQANIYSQPVDASEHRIESSEMDVSFRSPAMPDLEGVDPSVGEVTAEFDGEQEQIDIESGQFLSPEFEGVGDRIDIVEAKENEGPLKVNPYGDFLV